MGVVEEAVGEGEVSVVVELREDRRRKSLLGRNRAIGSPREVCRTASQQVGVRGVRR